MRNLRLNEGEIVLAGTEAGVESFGRGTEQGADTVLAVLEPSLDSLEVAGRIRYMAEGLGISRVRAIVNKTPDEATAERMLELLAEREIRCLGCLPLSGDVSRHALEGTPLEKTGPSYREIGRMLTLFLDENEMDHPLRTG